MANTWCGYSPWALWLCGNLKGVAQGRDALCTLFLVLLSEVSVGGCSQGMDFG